MTQTMPASPLQEVIFDRDLIARYDGKGPRYTSYPTADRFSTHFGAQDYQQALQQQAPGSSLKPLSLYFHLPFCNTICYYCACNKVITKDRSQADRYLDYLIREIHQQADQLPHRAKVWQLHLGGGTPTFLSDNQFERLMQAVRDRFELQPGGEFSIEIDPRKVSAQTVELLGRLGFNRMSVGVQDFNPAVQTAVNRIQSEEETRMVIECARKSGFQSISIDLIYGLPQQTESSVATTLKQVLQLRPDRLAFYNYAHLPDRFPPQRRIDSAALPSASQKLDILKSSIEQLTGAGYVFIGMDHFSLPDDELAIAQRRGQLHRNFQGYSTHADCDLMAFGVSAISKVGPSYSQNCKTLDDYYAIIDSGQLPVDRGITLTHDDLLRRAVIQSLMCQFELCFQPFEISYLIDFRSHFASELEQLRVLQEDGLLELENERILVTPRGRLLIRSIAMTFDRHLRERESIARFSRLI